MTGPEHYAKAQQLLSYEPATVMHPNDRERARDRAVARAHVHATLALAAATAGSPLVKSYLDVDDRTIEREWTAAIL